MADSPATRRILHFTDIGNLAGIVQAGRVLAHRAAPCAVDVGHAQIKANRTTTRVPCGPGGMVGDYVPFYYAPRSPMLFSIKCGNVENVSPDQRRLVYLASTAERAYAAGLRCVFSDGNAAAYFTEFADDPAAMDDHIDWPLMQATMWNSTAEDPDRMRRRMAEFLVHDAFPLDVLTGVAVYDAAIQDAVAGIVGPDMAVVVRRNWYF